MNYQRPVQKDSTAQQLALVCYWPLPFTCHVAWNTCAFATTFDWHYHIDWLSLHVSRCRDPSEEEMQLGDKIAALQSRVERGEGDQPRSAPKPSQAKQEDDSAESPEVAPRDSEDGTAAAPATPAPVSYAAAAKPVGEEEEEVPQQTVQQALDELESQLAKLTAELDDNVRFSKGNTGERESRWK